MANNTSLASNETVASCDSLSTQYTVPLAVSAAVFLVLGLLLILLGYRLFRATFFLQGLTWAALPVYLCLAHLTRLPVYAELSISLGAGLALALLALLLPHLGVALCGLSTGAVGGLLLLCVLELVSPLRLVWLPGLVLGVLGLSLAAVALRFQKPLIVLGSGVLGATLLCTGADYLLTHWRSVGYAWARVLAASAPLPCWWGWLLLALIPGLALLAIPLQLKLTARHTDHRPAMYPGGRRRGFQKVEMRDKTPVQEECSPPPQADFASTRYRHLYQIRRSNGDVISQQYIQSVQHKLSPAVRSMTSLNSPPSAHASVERPSTGVSSLTAVTHIPEVRDEGSVA